MQFALTLILAFLSVASAHRINCSCNLDTLLTARCCTGPGTTWGGYECYIETDKKSQEEYVACCDDSSDAGSNCRDVD
ncbi:hypothetical protein BUE80_DR001699 [Diplocarpon rosae]|nr:hypothetical protein BUE80_DR001699 [Diplocarpon rosae]